MGNSLDAIAQTPGGMMEWISVKNGLPAKYQRVLVTDGNKICLHYKQSMCNWENEIGHDLYCSCSKNHDYCDFVEGSITHWMPLPKPPLGPFS